MQQQEVKLQQRVLETAEGELQRLIVAAREACVAVGVNPEHAPFEFDDARFVITAAAPETRD